MMAVMIFVISILTLLQFFVSYSRSLIAESRGHELSDQAREICGLTARTAAGDQFRRLSELIALCPESGADGTTLLVVSAYFHLLGLLRTFVRMGDSFRRLPGSRRNVAAAPTPPQWFWIAGLLTTA